MEVIDPIKFIKKLWPDITLYDRQREILYSLRDNDETICRAANQLGKDFIAGLGVLWFFLSRQPCRIVTTSVDATQLNAVLWGEIRRFIQTSAFPLTSTEGGPILVNDLHLRKVVNGQVCGISYVLGRVAATTGEGMLGHHVAKTGDLIPRTLFVSDEASGVPTVYYDKADTWADRKLVIGNPFPCANFFKEASKRGDKPRTGRDGYYTKIIKIKAEDSPNVRLGLEQTRRGLPVTNEMLIPGVKDYATYLKNRELWDRIKQCIQLDAEFYEGAEVLMFPPQWLDRAERIGNELLGKFPKALTLGVDSAHGGDNTSWAGANKRLLLYLESSKTPDTSVIPGKSLALAHQLGVRDDDILFDAGGGGKPHADRLRSKGHRVRIVAFGEAATNVNTFKRMKTSKEKVEEKEAKTVYKNRRAEMYGMLRELLDPTNGPTEGFGIPSEIMNRPRSDGGPSLRQQLAPIPLLYDDEGTLYLLPKNKKPKTKSAFEEGEVKSLTELIGCSPDEADSVVLAIFGMMHKPTRVTAGALA